MNRRTAIRNVIIISAGAAVLPSCKNTGESSFYLKYIRVTASQEKMLAELAETIIPKTSNITGAKELKSHEFVLTMMDDCAGPEEQQFFMSGMKEFEDACLEKFNAPFEKCTPGQKKVLLIELETAKKGNDLIVSFYKTVKRYTIQSFTTSKNYLFDIKKWKMVPGNDFKGCIHV